LKKVAIITENDKLWSLSTWDRTIPLLKNKYDVVGLWTCDTKFSNISNKNINKWYIKNFGLFNFIKLGIFFLLHISKRFIMLKSINFSNLSRDNNIYYEHISSPNDKKFITWLQDNNIDILIIMVGHIIKSEVIESVEVIINKHASLLPSNKGIFPYFWAKLTNTPLGITFHLVDKNIDTGKIIYQVKIKDTFNSMIDFYIYVFNIYPKMLLKTIELIYQDKKDIVKNKNIKDSYYGLPKIEEFEIFNQKYNIITLKEIFRLDKLK